MSKMDNLRAMREARYEQRTAASARPAPKATRATTPTKPRPAEPQAPEPDSAGEALCGHRSMTGRTCTREQGHAAKSHRYS